jgi:hypothetical protein
LIRRGKLSIINMLPSTINRVLLVELEVAKGIIQKMHVVDDLTSPSETLAAILAQPAPVEARLLSSVQNIETSAALNVDLSETPCI